MPQLASNKHVSQNLAKILIFLKTPLMVNKYSGTVAYNNYIHAGTWVVLLTFLCSLRVYAGESGRAPNESDAHLLGGDVMCSLCEDSSQSYKTCLYLNHGSVLAAWGGWFHQPILAHTAAVACVRNKTFFLFINIEVLNTLTCCIYTAERDELQYTQDTRSACSLKAGN